MQNVNYFLKNKTKFKEFLKNKTKFKESLKQKIIKNSFKYHNDNLLLWKLLKENLKIQIVNLILLKNRIYCCLY